MSTKQKCHRYYLLSHFFLFSKIIPIIWSTKNWCKLVKMSEVFDYILECLQKLLPKFKIANAVIHFDEASPHMHVVGIPVWEGAKRGLSKKVSKRNVFTPQTLSVMHLSVTWRDCWRVWRRWLEKFIKNKNICSCNKVLTLTYEESIINLWSRRNKWDEKINFNQYKSERRRIR